MRQPALATMAGLIFLGISAGAQSAPAPHVTSLGPGGTMTPAAAAASSTSPAASYAAPALSAQPQSQGGLRLPAGTPIAVRLETPLSSDSVKAGGSFAARVMRSVWLGKTEAIPAGSILEGHVLRVRDRSPLEGDSELMLSPDYLRIPGAGVYIISASLDSRTVPTGEKINSEGVIRQGRGFRARDARRTGLSSVAGVVAGAAVAGGEGALLGAGVGAVAAGGWYLLHHRHLALGIGTPLVVRLARPVELHPQS